MEETLREFHGWEGTESNHSSSNSTIALAPEDDEEEEGETGETTSETTQTTTTSAGGGNVYSGTAASTCTASTEIKEYYLKKRRPNPCRNGLDWQNDPTGETRLHNNLNWPRDFALIRGRVVTVSGENNLQKQWLLATEVKQSHSAKWRKAPKGAALPFFYSNLYVLIENKRYIPNQKQEEARQYLNEQRQIILHHKDDPLTTRMSLRERRRSMSCQSCDNRDHSSSSISCGSGNSFYSEPLPEGDSLSLSSSTRPSARRRRNGRSRRPSQPQHVARFQSKPEVILISVSEEREGTGERQE